MIETLLASVGAGFAPEIAHMLPEADVGLIGTMILHKLSILAVIVAVTVVTNVVRALRYCRDSKQEFKSSGILWGVKKGLTAGILSMGTVLTMAFIPVVNGLVASQIGAGISLGMSYLFWYMTVAYPTWGVC